MLTLCKTGPHRNVRLRHYTINQDASVWRDAWPTFKPARICLQNPDVAAGMESTTLRARDWLPGMTLVTNHWSELLVRRGPTPEFLNGLLILSFSHSYDDISFGVAPFGGSEIVSPSAHMSNVHLIIL